MTGGLWPFVGRRRYVDRIRLAFGRSPYAGLVIAGVAGVGKSRLATECANHAELDGFQVKRVLATRAAAGIPLGALAPLLPPGAYPETLRGDTLARVAETIGSGDRLLLLVDDVHLLDDASAAVIHLIAARHQATVLLTMRSGPDVTAPETVLSLWKDGLVDRLDLEPLDREQVDELLDAILHGPIDGACRRDLWQASEGNVLYLRELIQGGLESGTLSFDDGLWRLTHELTTTARLCEIVDARLADLPSEARDLLELLALGEPLELPLLVQLADLEVLQSLEKRGLATATEDGLVQLGHPVHGEVLRRRMTASTKMTASRLLATAAEAAEQQNRPDNELRRAIWRLDSGDQVDPELTLRAARQAYFTHDTEVAQRLAQAAYSAGAGIPAGLLLAEVLGECGRQPERLDVLQGLRQNARTDSEIAMVALDHAYATFWGLARASDAVDCLTDAEQRVAPGAWRDELIAQRATLALLSGNLPEAIDLAQEVRGRNEGGRPVVKAALAAAPALAISGRTDEAVAVAQQGLTIQLALGDQEVMSDPGVHIVAQAVAFGQAGRLAEADAILAAGYQSTLARRARGGQAWCAMQRANIAVLTGQLTTAASLYAEGAAIYADLAVPGLRRWCIAGTALTAGQQGDAATARSAIEMLDQLPARPFRMMEPEVIRARAWQAVAAGDLALAGRRLHRAIHEAENSGADALAAGAWHDLVRLDQDVDAAADALGRLLDRVDGDLVAARELHARGVARNEPELLVNAADRFAALGASLFAAEAYATAAGLSRRQHKARQADGLAARAHELAAECPSANTPALGLAGPAAVLTTREREVAALAAQGLSSKEIAEQFTLSVRTVDSHLLRTYTKLGVGSRTELAAALTRAS